jgi:hypothetical protein
MVAGGLGSGEFVAETFLVGLVEMVLEVGQGPVGFILFAPSLGC